AAWPSAAGRRSGSGPAGSRPGVEAPPRSCPPPPGTAGRNGSGDEVARGPGRAGPRSGRHDGPDAVTQSADPVPAPGGKGTPGNVHGRVRDLTGHGLKPLSIA